MYLDRDDYYQTGACSVVEPPSRLEISTEPEEIFGLETKVISHERFRELLKIKKSLQRQIHVQTGRAKQVLHRTVASLDIIIQASPFYEAYIAQMAQRKYVA